MELQGRGGLQHLTHRLELIVDLQNWGFSCQRVLAVDVVAANGETLHCDEKEHSDLFWAARGSGPGMKITSLLRP